MKSMGYRLASGLLQRLGLRAETERKSRREVDVVVSHVEVNGRHGAGVLTRRLFADAPALISVYSRQDYDGHTEIGERGLQISHLHAERPEVFEQVLRQFAGLRVRRIVCIPYYPDDVRTAIALRELFDARLCTYVMDDQNVESASIPDALMGELLAKSALRLVISPEMQRAYARKYPGPFHFVPPLVEPALLLRTPVQPVATALQERRGLLVGNIWNRDWLELLRELVRSASLRVDWYSSGGTPWMQLSDEALRADGIHRLPALPEAELSPVLQRAAFVLHPSGRGDAGDSGQPLARLSLPSKLPYVLATSGTPALVLGAESNAAAQFVQRSGTGLWSPYAAKPFADAVQTLCDPDVQRRMRARAAELAPSFSSEGARDWLWRSMELGAPLDDRWERLGALLEQAAAGNSTEAH